MICEFLRIRSDIKPRIGEDWKKEAFLIILGSLVKEICVYFNFFFFLYEEVSVSPCKQKESVA